jgi:hypothetical protein
MVTPMAPNHTPTVSIRKYAIRLDGQLIGYMRREWADPPMGCVGGRTAFWVFPTHPMELSLSITARPTTRVHQAVLKSIAWASMQTFGDPKRQQPQFAVAQRLRVTPML